MNLANLSKVCRIYLGLVALIIVAQLRSSQMTTGVFRSLELKSKIDLYLVTNLNVPGLQWSRWRNGCIYGQHSTNNYFNLCLKEPDNQISMGVLLISS